MAKTTVSITEENGKWRVTGTTYIDNDPNKPWPVDVVFDRQEQAQNFAAKHGWIVS